MKTTFCFSALLGALFSSPSFAQVGFTNLDQSDLQTITRESSAGFRHSSTGSASRTEKDFGVEVGVVAGDASIRSIGNLLAEFGPTAPTNLPKAGLFVGLNLVKGLSLEAIYQPKIGLEAISFNGASFGVKSNINQFMDLSFDCAVKAHYSSSKFTWLQTISSVDSDMTFAQNTLGVDAQFSRKYGYFEPYANLGVSMATGKMSSSSTATVFDSTYSTGTSSEEKVSGLSYGVGLSASLLNMNFGFEVMSIYSAMVTSFKASSTF